MIEVKGEFKDNVFNLESKEDLKKTYDSIRDGEDILLVSKDKSKVYISNSLKSKLDDGEIELQGRNG